MTSDSPRIETTRGRDSADRRGEFVLRELTNGEFVKWDELVDRSPQGSLFCSTWWLQTVCEEPRILGLFSGDNLVAGMPLYCERRCGFQLHKMPQLTQTWGPILEPLTGRNSTALTREIELLRPFAQHLAGLTFFHQAFHPSLQNWLPFYWNGFTQTTRFTYVLDNISDTERVVAGMTHQARGQIAKADRLGLTIEPATADMLWEFVLKTFTRQGKPITYTHDYLTRICAAAILHQQGAIFAVVDSNKNIHAVGFVVWDVRRAYYLVSGSDARLRNSGAATLLAWHLIHVAAAHTGIFDFEGSMLESVERFFRSFGARQVPYNWILKVPALAYAYLNYAKKL